MKLTFRNQMILSCTVVVLFNLLNMIFKQWVFTSIGFVIFGLFWIIHPVMPKNAVKSPKALWAVRAAGVVVVLIGILTRSYY